MKTAKILTVIFCIQLFAIVVTQFAHAEASDTITSQTRCTVCGMFVAKYPSWLAQIQYENSEQTKFFDGVKDLMVFYFNPERFGEIPNEKVKDIFVKDYYSLNWFSAKDAFYVMGSDVYGPMGHELIPFESRDAAESFLKDHHGKEILIFDMITPELIESLRVGQRMR